MTVPRLQGGALKASRRTEKGIKRRRIHQAPYLPRDISLSVTEVARRIGYDDLFYFSKLFKRHLGVSPRRYSQQ